MSSVTWTVADGVGRIVLNRADQGNAIDKAGFVTRSSSRAPAY